MEKSFMTRVLAVSLSAAMAFSLSTATNLSKVYAKNYFSGNTALSLSKLDKTGAEAVDVGTHMIFKLTGTQKSKWQVKSVSSSNKEIVEATGTGTNAKKTQAIFDAKASGEANLFVRVEKKADTSKTHLFKIPVEVKSTDAKITAVSQTKAAELVVTMSPAIESVKAADFKVVRENGNDNTVIPIKSVALDATDKTKVTITTHADMLDGKTYTVTYTAPTETKTESSAQFTAAENVVADLGLSAYNVTAGTAEEVKIQTLSATGVVLAEVPFTGAAGKNLEYSWVPSAATGYIQGDKLYLQNIGDVATIKVTYHTYKYGTDGTETGAITKELQVTAVADATTMSNWGYTIATSKPAWNSASYKQNTKVAINAAANTAAYFNFKDSKGNDKTDAGYTISSSDTSKLLIADGTIANKSTAYTVKGVAVGTAYIVVKNKAGVVVATLPVEVVAEVAATSLVLDTNNISVSNGSSAKDVKTVKFTVKDQYGDKMKAASEQVPALEALSYPDGVTKAQAESVAGINGKAGAVTITGSAFKKGTYVYKVKVTYNKKEVTSNLVINILEPGTGAETYAVRLDGADATNTVDLAVSDKTEGKKITVKVDVLKDGVLDHVVNPTVKVTVKRADGTIIEPSNGVNEFVLSTQSGAAILKKADTGSYTVDTTYSYYDATAKKTIDVKVPLTNLTIKDTQVAATSSVKKTAANGATLVSLFQNKDFVTVEYDGQELTLVDDPSQVNGTATTVGAASYAASKAEIVSFDALNVSTDKDRNFYVKSVKLIIQTADGAYMYQDVPVNATFTDVSNAG